MRWSGILAPLKHSHSATLGLSFGSRAALSTLPSRATPLPEQTSATSKARKVSSSQDTAITEAAKASSRQTKTSPKRSSSKNIAIAEDISSLSNHGSVKPSSPSKSVRRPIGNKFAAEIKDISFTEGAVKHEPGRSQALSQENTKPLEVSHVKVRASSLPYSAQVDSSAGKPSLSNLADGYGDRHSFAQVVTSARKRISGKINNIDDEKASARSTRAQCKAKRGVPSVQSPLCSKGATKESGCGTTVEVQSREKSVGVAGKPGALNERPGDGISHADENVAVGTEVLTEDIASSLNSDSSVSRLPEASTSPEGKDESDQVVGGESKKPSFLISFPVTVFTEWWFSCFVKGAKPYPKLYVLNRIHVWLAAYQRAHLDETGIYTDGQSASVLIKQLEDLSYAVSSGNFRWGEKTHVYLPSPLDYFEEKLRPLPDVDRSFSFQDRVVQEVLYLVLEPIFEARFSARSHAFRPGRDAHTALRAVQRSFLGCTWFMRGDLSILQEELYATHLVDSVLRVVWDTRVAFLLRSGLLEGKLGQGEVTYASMFANHGSCSRLMHLLCNAFLDQFDWWMDEQMYSFSKKEKPLIRCSSSLLFKSSRATIERRRKFEYTRYGTEFLVGCNGTGEEAELVKNNIQSFLKQQLGKNAGINLTVSHISAGVEFLDHVISQKIVHPIVSCRRASNGRVFEKRALRIRLCVKASRECCLMYLKEIGTPTSLQHIKEMLSVLNNWYQYAQNKEKVIEYCKLTLCDLYAKGVGERHKEGSLDTDFAEQFKEATQMVMNDQMKGGDFNKVKTITYKDFIWMPEHENILRDHVFLQNKPLIAQTAASFKNSRKLSPQQDMSQLLWQFLRGNNGDQGWEPDVQLQTLSLGIVDQKQEELAESAG